MFVRIHIRSPQLSAVDVKLFDHRYMEFDYSKTRYSDELEKWASIGIIDSESRISAMN